MKSKKLVKKHLQSVLDSGMTHADIARELGIDSTNFISMLKNLKEPKSLLSPNRIKEFARLCQLTPQEVMRLMFARLDDAAGNKIELSKETMKYILLTFVACVDEHRAQRAA